MKCTYEIVVFFPCFIISNMLTLKCLLYIIKSNNSYRRFEVGSILIGVFYIAIVNLDGVGSSCSSDSRDLQSIQSSPSIAITISRYEINSILPNLNTHGNSSS
uniref:Uncharacterized protein n=1 Tax=Cucumis sativus TaxID=3659 RepID=A0A0A0KXB1_CUCSA